MASESKKEAFRKYLESSGVLDALTKVLVGLYEENDKPKSAIEFIQHNLGGPTTAEFQALKTEKEELEVKHEDLQTRYEQICKEMEELKLTLQKDTPSEVSADS